MGGAIISILSTQRRSRVDGRQSLVALLSLLAVVGGGMLLVALAQLHVSVSAEAEPTSTMAMGLPFGPPPPAELPLPDAATPAVAPPPEQPPTPPDDWRRLEVRQGDSLSKLFAEQEIDPADLSLLLRSGAEAESLNVMKEGYKLALKLDESGRLEQFRLTRSPLDELVFSRDGSRFGVERVRHVPRVAAEMKSGTVSSSLFAAAEREQVSFRQSMRMVEILGGKIDFILDTRPGDRFAVFYETLYLDDELVGEGEMLAARFVNQGEEHLALRYENLAGEVGYFGPDGSNMQATLMRNPLDVIRISSHFNPNRRHPILNTIRAHKGADYAAPTGTPVRATSDGRVTRASRYGSYGNIVIIDHHGGLETRYAHLSRFAQGITPGVRVRQGEVIGFVGATGSATGPHLHYEVRKDGVAQDPSRVHELVRHAPGIGADEMDRFNSHTESLLAQLDALDAETLLGRNDTASAD